MVKIKDILQLVYPLRRVFKIRGGKGSGYHGPDHKGLPGEWGGSRPREGGEPSAPSGEKRGERAQLRDMAPLLDQLEKLRGTKIGYTRKEGKVWLREYKDDKDLTGKLITSGKTVDELSDWIREQLEKKILPPADAKRASMEALTDISIEAAENVFNELGKEQMTQARRELEGLGVRLSQWSKWSGEELMVIGYAALTDANWHTEAQKLYEKSTQVAADDSWAVEMDEANPFTAIAREAAENCFNELGKSTMTQRRRELEGLGTRLSQWSKWDGDELMVIFYAALEDSNWHSEAGWLYEASKEVARSIIIGSVNRAFRVRGGKGSGYHGPDHVGLPGVHGGSKKRGGGEAAAPSEAAPKGKGVAPKVKPKEDWSDIPEDVINLTGDQASRVHDWMMANMSYEELVAGQNEWLDKGKSAYDEDERTRANIMFGLYGKAAQEKGIREGREMYGYDKPKEGAEPAAQDDWSDLPEDLTQLSSEQAGRITDWAASNMTPEQIESVRKELYTKMHQTEDEAQRTQYEVQSILMAQAQKKIEEGGVEAPAPEAPAAPAGPPAETAAPPAGAEEVEREPVYQPAILPTTEAGVPTEVPPGGWREMMRPGGQFHESLPDDLWQMTPEHREVLAKAFQSMDEDDLRRDMDMIHDRMKRIRMGPVTGHDAAVQMASMTSLMGAVLDFKQQERIAEDWEIKYGYKYPYLKYAMSEMAMAIVNPWNPYTYQYTQEQAEQSIGFSRLFEQYLKDIGEAPSIDEEEEVETRSGYVKKGGKGSGYHSPHKGLEGVHGGSAPRDGGEAEVTSQPKPKPKKSGRIKLGMGIEVGEKRWEMVDTEYEELRMKEEETARQEIQEYAEKLAKEKLRRTKEEPEAYHSDWRARQIEIYGGEEGWLAHDIKSTTYMLEKYLPAWMAVDPISERQKNALRELKTDDFQDRGGEYPRADVPDSINITEQWEDGLFRMHADFKNTDEGTSLRWVRDKLDVLGVLKSVLSLKADQTGDYQDDWVQVTAIFRP